MKHFCSNSRLACPRSDCAFLCCTPLKVSLHCTVSSNSWPV